MAIILDPLQIKKLQGKKRLRKLRPDKVPPKPEGALLKRMNQLWEKVLFPATERIQRLVEAKATPSEIASVIEQVMRRAEFEYNLAAEDIVWRWRLSLEQDTRIAFIKGLRASLGVDIAAIFEDQALTDALAMAGMEAANLIKSIPSDYLGQVARAVADNFTGVPQPENRNLLQQIKHIGGVTDKRAKLIARDQTAKLTGALTRVRQQSIGVEMYIWRTVRDERVVGRPGGNYPIGSKRHSNHFMMEGLYCRWDDPTVYSNDKGRTWLKRTQEMPKNHPKDDIQCRCHAAPVIDLEKILEKARVS